MKMEVTLSKDEVIQIIEKHLQDKFMTVGKVRIEVGEEWQGYGPNETRAIAFKGAKCEVEL